MRADHVIGYTADAAVWCPSCAVTAYGAEIETDAPIEDSEGNRVWPIFASDEDSALEHCGSCGVELVEHCCADHDEDYGPYLEAFTQSYALAMLWANTRAVCDVHETRMTAFGFHCVTENHGYCNFDCDESEHPHDVEVDPYAWQTPSSSWAIEAFDSDAQAEIRRECEDFVRANWSDLKLASAGARFRGSDYTAEMAGHDFALTRNHHGAGFWDRGLGDVGERLTTAAHAYGESSGYLAEHETEVHLS